MDQIRTKRLVLGTAQFGMDYGITNVSGQPSKQEAFDILELAWENRVRRFDTAPAYGSEELLGEFITANGLQNEAIVLTKIPSLEGSSDYRKLIRSNIETSLKYLGSTIDVLFFHNPIDSILLLKDFDYFESLLNEYPVSNLGVSVYCPDEVERLNSFEFDLAVQFPYNILDRRFENIIMTNRLRYARSIFLQGVLASKKYLIERVPIGLKRIHNKIHYFFEKKKIDPINYTLQFIANSKKVDYFIFGVDNKNQLEEIISMESKEYYLDQELKNLIGTFEKRLLDPRNWN